jgi:hypothetical protein
VYASEQDLVSLTAHQKNHVTFREGIQLDFNAATETQKAEGRLSLTTTGNVYEHLADVDQAFIKSGVNMRSRDFPHHVMTRIVRPPFREKTDCMRQGTGHTEVISDDELPAEPMVTGDVTEENLERQRVQQQLTQIFAQDQAVANVIQRGAVNRRVETAREAAEVLLLNQSEPPNVNERQKTQTLEEMRVEEEARRLTLTEAERFEEDCLQQEAERRRDEALGEMDVQAALVSLEEGLEDIPSPAFTLDQPE